MPMTTEPMDGSDFTTYVAARRRTLLGSARAITGDDHAAEDLVQCALTKVYRAWPQIRDPQAVDAYVRRAMVNQNTSWWRQAWRREERATGVVPEPRAPGRGTGTAGPAAEVGIEDRSLLWDLVQQLPARQRTAVVLRYYEDLPEAEVAGLMRCSVGTVKSNTSRGLATLRRMYVDATAA